MICDLDGWLGSQYFLKVVIKRKCFASHFNPCKLLSETVEYKSMLIAKFPWTLYDLMRYHHLDVGKKSRSSLEESHATP